MQKIYKEFGPKNYDFSSSGGIITSWNSFLWVATVAIVAWDILELLTPKHLRFYIQIQIFRDRYFICDA